MKKLIAGMAVVALMVIVGCENKAGDGGTNVFSVQAPSTIPDVKPGEKQEVKLSIERGKDFKEEVTLKFEAPKGMNVEPETKAVAAGEKEVAVKVGAAADAPEGKQTISIIATPKKGKAVTTKLDVNVKKGDAK